MPGNELQVLEEQLRPLAPHFEQVLGNRMPASRLLRTVLISCERTPKLLACTRESIISAAMSAAVLGLEVDGVTGQAFLIPFKVKGVARAQLVIGYKGFNTLAARDAQMTITGEAVREGDEFDYELGTRAFVHHKPSLAPIDDRPVRAAWSAAQSLGMPPIFVVLGISEVEAIKARAPGGRREDSPWNDPFIGFPAMVAKTAKRRLARSLPSGLYQMGAALDQAVEEEGRPAYIRPPDTVVIDGLDAPKEMAPPTAATPVAPARKRLTQARSSMSFEDYSEFLDTIIADATDAEELADAFNAHKGTHGKFTNDEYDELRERVMKRVDELDRVADAEKRRVE